MNDIVVKGARQNNLKNISVKIPKNKLVAFTGMSGSGKSSLVFETIAGEAQRQLFETFSTFAQSRLPKYEQADYDEISNLSPVIVLAQKRIVGNSRSSVGSLSEISSYLRLLFSRMGTPEVGMSNHFSPHTAEGSCPNCGGVGQLKELQIDRLINTKLSLNTGALLFPDFKVGSLAWKLVVNSGLFDIDTALMDFSEEDMQTLLYAENIKFKLSPGDRGFEANFHGVVTKIQRGYLTKNFDALSSSRQKAIAPFIKATDCKSCHGTGLKEEALACKIKGKNIVDLSAMQLTELLTFFRSIDAPELVTVLSQLIKRTEGLVNIGVGYLNLSRPVRSLSGGEAQRVQLAKQLRNSLTGMIYVLDEPSTGLHPRDVAILADILKALCKKGNSVLVVEHDPDLIKVADWIIDMGPLAGKNGGEVVFEGTYEALLSSETTSGRLLKAKITPKTNYRSWSNSFVLNNATANNLKNISLRIPKEVFVCVTGVAGSGKSSLIHKEFLVHHPAAIVIDQAPVGKSIRSNPATYTGVFDGIRKLFASENPGTKASLFSFNAEGACLHCKGLGFTLMDLAFMESVKSTCPHCEGNRYRKEALKYKYKGKNIAEVLECTINEALDFFEEPKILAKLAILEEVGLGYLQLGQTLSTLSGGECQRVKLASELHKKGQVYILDEPTTGLHMSDVERMIDLLNRLVDAGNSVIVIEHNLDIMNQADWIIDLGPEGGEMGGELLFEGTPRNLQLTGSGHTANYLKKYNLG